MPHEQLDEREFELVNIVGAKIASNQRDLSRHMDLSLGMINMLIKRLVTKGYIRTKQLNKRKVEYILTPKGFSEKMRKSVKYTVKTLNSIGMIKDKLKALLVELYDSGERNFIILGESDLAFLVDFALKEIGHNDYEISHVQEIPPVMNGGVLLICKEMFDTQLLDSLNKTVNVIEELAKDNFLYNFNGRGE